MTFHGRFFTERQAPGLLAFVAIAAMVAIILDMAGQG